jgi:hypothetical protein
MLQAAQHFCCSNGLITAREVAQMLFEKLRRGRNEIRRKIVARSCRILEPVVTQYA